MLDYQIHQIIEETYTIDCSMIWYMKCCKCDHPWLDVPGALAFNYKGCPNCESLYWVWYVSVEYLNSINEK
jgi:hypothetical protein